MNHGISQLPTQVSMNLGRTGWGKDRTKSLEA